MSDKELDNLFKEAAEGFKAPMDSAAWKDMSSRLDQAGVGTSVFWNWKTISSITAVVIIASTTLIWYASQNDAEQPIAKNTPSRAQIESGTLKPNQPALENATEANSADDQKEQSVLSSNSGESQKSISESKSISSTVDESKPIASTRSSHESVHGFQGSGDESKVTTKVAPTSAFPGDARATGKQDVTVNKNQHIEAAVIPTGAVVINGRTAPETKITPSNASADSKANASEASQQDLAINKNQQAGAKIIPDGIIVASVSTEPKIENQHAIANEKQISNSTIDPTANKSISENKSSNQVANERLLDADSVVKPIEDLPVVAVRADSTSKKEAPKEVKAKAGRTLSLKLAVAPDFSSINYFTPDGSGFNFGALVGYSFNNRWSVYTGAILSRKIYSSTEIDEPYTTSSGYPYEVNELAGDCRVLDIPINVYYTFFPEKSFSLKAGIGFTSYLMLSEEYTYYIDNPYGSDVYYQKIENENNEWFKMMNVSVIIQKKLGNQFALELEPFLKAPLAGVGEGEVSLVSLGAFLNVRFDIPINKRIKNGE